MEGVKIGNETYKISEYLFASSRIFWADIASTLQDSVYFIAITKAEKVKGVDRIIGPCNIGVHTTKMLNRVRPSRAARSQGADVATALRQAIATRMETTNLNIIGDVLKQRIEIRMDYTTSEARWLLVRAAQGDGLRHEFLARFVQNGVSTDHVGQ